jgi:hypothetical protein
VRKLDHRVARAVLGARRIIDDHTFPAAVLIDDYLPRYDVRERHSLLVHASPTATYAALRSANLADTPLVRALLALRALPGALGHGRAGLASLRRRGGERITLATFEDRGFRVLAENPPAELLIGLEGQFWRPSGGLCTPPAELFLTGDPGPGMARAVWNFALEPAAGGGTELRTETRVHCADATTRRRFLPYWLLIRPWSGLIRRAMLRAIRRTAEQSTGSSRSGVRCGE